MRSIIVALLLLLLTAGPTFATEYWSGYDSSGNRVEIVVRYGDKIYNGADIIFRDVGKSTQMEGSVVAVEFLDENHARVEVYVNGQRRTCEVSR